MLDGYSVVWNILLEMVIYTNNHSSHCRVSNTGTMFNIGLSTLDKTCRKTARIKLQRHVYGCFIWMEVNVWVSVLSWNKYSLLNMQHDWRLWCYMMPREQRKWYVIDTPCGVSVAWPGWLFYLSSGNFLRLNHFYQLLWQISRTQTGECLLLESLKTRSQLSSKLRVDLDKLINCDCSKGVCPFCKPLTEKIEKLPQREDSFVCLVFKHSRIVNPANAELPVYYVFSQFPCCFYEFNQRPTRSCTEQSLMHY